MNAAIPSPFQAELIRELKRIRRTCDADGSSLLGFDCLFNSLNFRNLPSVPRGTNAVYFIKQELRSLLLEREFDGLADRSSL